MCQGRSFAKSDLRWSRIRSTGERDDILKFSDHFVERLSLVDTAAREWMGLVAYWITGKNSEFFPGSNEREGLRDLQWSFDLVDATQVLIDP